MTDLVVDRLKEVVVLDDYFYKNLEDFFKYIVSSTMPGSPMVVFWSEGVVLTFMPIEPVTDLLVKEMVENRRTYWSFLRYALMPKYREYYEYESSRITIVYEGSPVISSVCRQLKGGENDGRKRKNK